MSNPEAHSWTSSFGEGDELKVTLYGEHEAHTVRLFSAGKTYLHVLVDPGAELLGRLRQENRVTLEGSPGEDLPAHARGTFQVIDVGPSEYERVTGTKEDWVDERQTLLRFEATGWRPQKDQPWSPVPSKRPSQLVCWIQALRLYAMSASLVPLLLGIAYALWMTRSGEWAQTLNPLFGLLAVLGGVFLHLGTNLQNDVTDHEKGIDFFGGFGGAGIIQKGWLSPKQVSLAAKLFFAAGVCCGAPLLYVRGLDLIVIGVLGFLGATGYSHRHLGYKYAGLGDLSVFALMGPLMVLGASIALCGHWTWDLVLVSLPIGVLVTLILHANNIDDIPIDRRAGATTLAIGLGFKASKVYYLVLLLAGYLGIAALALTDLAPSWVFLSYLTLPLALKNLHTIAKAKNPGAPGLGALRMTTAQLHMGVGVLYVVAFFIAAF